MSITTNVSGATTSSFYLLYPFFFLYNVIIMTKNTPENQRPSWEPPTFWEELKTAWSEDIEFIMWCLRYPHALLKLLRENITEAVSQVDEKFKKN
jgi:hypothetical protein